MSFTCACGKTYDGYAQCFPCPAEQERLEGLSKPEPIVEEEEGVPPEIIEGTSVLKKNKTIVTDINTLKENNLTVIGSCKGLILNFAKNKNSSYISTSNYQTLNSYDLSGNNTN